MATAEEKNNIREEKGEKLEKEKEREETGEEDVSNMLDLGWKLSERELSTALVCAIGRSWREISANSPGVRANC